MTTEYKNIIRTVREEALSKGRLDLLDGLYSDGYVYHGIPMLGDVRGPSAFKELVKPFLAAISGFQETVDDQVAEGEKVVTRLSGRGTHTGEIMGAPPTGKRLTWTALVMTRFDNDKIAEEWVEFDGLSLLQQLGIVPTMR